MYVEIARCVYDETIPLPRLGRVKIRRGSHVEPVAGGSWIADMKPVDGPILGPFALRSQALTAESAGWKNWLSST